MFHPLEEDLSLLKDSEIENRLNELSKKYFQAARLGNHNLLTQVETFVTIYRNELSNRYIRNTKGDDNDLGQLINVD